jgi:ribose transport system ATP-binding protein
MMRNSAKILEIKNILKDYPGVRAVNNASISVKKGEIHGLVGENGAGKSTIVKILAGVVQPDDGEIWLNGKQVKIPSGSDSYRLSFSFIHQELNLVPFFSAAENIFLGRSYPTRVCSLINWKVLNKSAKSILNQLGVDIPVNIPIVNLSQGEKSIISIARAFASNASVYIMDEPTASSTDDEIKNFFSVIRKLKKQGATILYISHRLNEIFEICDRVTVMRDGNVIGTYRTDEINQSKLIQMMIGRKLKGNSSTRKRIPGRVLLKVDGLSGSRVKDISFYLHKGEILGFAGLVGAGRTDILRMLYGVDFISAGKISIEGKPYHPKSPAKANSKGIVLLPEERRTQGLIMGHSITKNIVLPYLKKLSRYGVFINHKNELKISSKASKAVHLKTDSLNKSVSKLSGGNQQKVVFARWLVTDEVRILLLDEPTRGVDIGARFEIYKIIKDLISKGISILLVSSDLSELMELADRVVIMREGIQMATLDIEGLTQETVLRYCYGEEKRISNGE